jgi:hypothetical protein
MVTVQIIRPDAGLELLCIIYAVSVAVLNAWEWFEPEILDRLRK